MDPIQSREEIPPSVRGFGVTLFAAAIVIGVFIALVVQILLALLGAGIGFSAFRVPATAAKPLRSAGAPSFGGRSPGSWQPLRAGSPPSSGRPRTTGGPPGLMAS